jgi:hypothetical protein
MAVDLTIEQLLARVETRIASLRDRVSFHAAEEAKHRAERERHAALLEELDRERERLQASSARAAEIINAGHPPAPAELSPSERRLSRLLAQVLPEFGAEEPFGARAVSRAIDRRFQAALRRPTDTRLVAIALSRLARRGLLRRIRPGRPHWEALYVHTRM